MDRGTDAHCWGNAVFAFGTVLIREFGNTGWFSHIRGTSRNHLGGGLVTDLPRIHFHTDVTGVAAKPITSVIVTDELEKMLVEQGFIPLCQCHDTPLAAFHGNSSTQKPRTYDSTPANINARLSAMIQHILCASRFAHYIKVMIRDKVGSFFSAAECETYLQRWLREYVAGSDGLDWEMQARYPLRDARVTVMERPDKPGFYNSIIHLKPHYQLDQMVSELKLMTELAAVSARR
jgi:type VI secretion system protein ImpD